MNVRTLLKVGEGQRMKRVAELVAPINALEDEMRARSDDELRASTQLFRERLAAGETLDDVLIEAFAVAREAARRVLGQRPYDEQLMAAMALHFGWIAEMKTGEGKTLAAVVAAYLNALEGRGVHIMTANDYLVLRDYLTMGPFFAALGMTTGAVHPETTAHWMKRNGYRADVTYGTITEFGFDYLRDNMATSLEGVVQRDLFFAIIDEVDAVLIDEAKTPLVISGPGPSGADQLARVEAFVRTLKAGEDFEVDREHFVVHLLDSGVDKAEEYFSCGNLYDVANVEHLHRLAQALRAHGLYERDRDYLVHDGVVEIIDPNTGRTLEGRRWSDGLHQAIEVKEGAHVQEETTVLATITVQYLVRLYDKVAGMSGTAKTDEEEFGFLYQLPVVEVPTHLPSRRIDHPELIYRTQEEKFAAILDEVRARHAKGQPLLLGTASVERSDYLSEQLRRAGLAHEVLHAKHPEREAAVIAQSGREGSITVATNMAGRGVDILLGGDPVALAQAEALAGGLQPGTPEGQEAFDAILAQQRAACTAEGDRVRALGGLFVLGSERHDSRRVDDQLRGRAGRQGDPGESQYFLSLEDDIMEVFDAGRMKAAMARAVAPGQPLRLKVVSNAVRKAQAAAEARDAKSREQTFRYDEVLAEQRAVLYTLRREVLVADDVTGIYVKSRQRYFDQVAARWCAEEWVEEWDVEGLVADLRGVVDVDPNVVLEAADEMGVAEYLASLLDEKVLVDGKVRNDRVAAVRTGLLSAIDVHWRAHLLDMAELRDGISWRQHARLAPLVQWSLEGYVRFGELLDLIDATFVRSLAQGEESRVEGE